MMSHFARMSSKLISGRSKNNLTGVRLYSEPLLTNSSKPAETPTVTNQDPKPVENAQKNKIARVSSAHPRYRISRQAARDIRRQVQVTKSRLLEQTSKLLGLSYMETISSGILTLEKYKLAAKYIGVEVSKLTAYQYAEWHLEQQKQYAMSLDLKEKALYSQEGSIEYAQKKFDILKKVIPENYHNLFNGSEAAILISRSKKKKNEMEIGFEVEKDVYDAVKAQIAPVLKDLGVTPEIYVDFHGGENAVIDPYVIKIEPIYNRILSSKDDNERLKYQDLLMFETIVNNGKTRDCEADDLTKMSGYEYRNLAHRQRRAQEKISEVLGRECKFGDFDIESRFRAGTYSSHPFFLDSPKRYIYGELCDVGNYKSGNEVLFKNKQFYNSPDHFREISADALKTVPELYKGLQKALLSFPSWEEDAERPRNAGEAMVSMNLWNLYNVVFPELAGSNEKQLLFSELYDISPGEPTLDWCMSYPAKEHTFFPEHPMWIYTREDDDIEVPVSWPDYEPVLLRGRAKIEPRADKTLIRFQSPSQSTQTRMALQGYLLDRLNTSEYADISLRNSELLKNLTPAEVSSALTYWNSLDSAQREHVVEQWNNSDPFERSQAIRRPRILQEVKRLSNYMPSPTLSCSYTDSFPNVVSPENDHDSIKCLYKSLLDLHSDYFSSGGVKEVFHKLLACVQNQLEVLNKVHPELHDISRQVIDVDRLSQDQNALLEASQKIKKFLQSEEYFQLAHLRRQNEDRDYLEQKKKLSSQVEAESLQDSLKSPISLPDGVFVLSKPISQLTDEERVFAVVSQYNDILKPIEKIVPSSTVVDWADQLFKPLYHLNTKLRQYNERMYLNAVNDIIRPSESNKA